MWQVYLWAMTAALGVGVYYTDLTSLLLKRACIYDHIEFKKKTNHRPRPNAGVSKRET